MKKILFLAALIALGWFVYSQLKSRATQEAIKQSQPVKYVSSLQNDVKKAEDVKDKANALMQQQQKDMERGLKDTGSQ